MNIILKKRLNTYAIAASCFLYCKQEASGQVVYTDIEPDLILDHELFATEVDMNNDGLSDFFFHNNSFVYYHTSWLSDRTMQNILVGPDEVGNALAGISVYFTTGYGEFTRYYPFALDQGSFIGEIKTWQAIETQIMALRVLSEDGDIVGFGFYAWYEYLSETVDKYLGVRFNDLEGVAHYGWIRCDVLDEGRILVIKDYAYETEPEYPITAGDTTHFVGISEVENNLDADVYSFNSNVYINSNEIKNDVEINIYDITGKIIYSDKINNQFTEIKLSEGGGIYIVKLIAGENQLAKKIYIN